MLRLFPFGGVRQTLFLSPFLFAFAALGFYALGGNRLTRMLAGTAAVVYLALWVFNLPRFYQERVVAYRAEDVVKLWREQGKIPSYGWKATLPLQYVLRDYPEMHVEKFAADYQVPFLLISPNHRFEEHSDLAKELHKEGFELLKLAEKPTHHSESEQYPTCLYFPPNGFAVYKAVPR